MKASLLLENTGSLHLDMNEMMFKNALHEIDYLEAAANDLQKQVNYYEGLFQKLRKFARCEEYGHGPFVSIGNIYEDDNAALFADLMELLQLEEKEKEEDEKNE